MKWRNIGILITQHVWGLCTDAKMVEPMHIRSLCLTTVLLLSMALELGASGQEPATPAPARLGHYQVTQAPQTIHTHDPGRPLITSMEISCGLTKDEIRSVLCTLDLYDSWVIRALNDSDALKANPMSVFDAVIADHKAQELSLLFDFQRPFKIEDVTIPFTFVSDILTQDPFQGCVEIMLRSPNIAVKDAGLRILYSEKKGDQNIDQNILSTIRAEIIVDFTGLIDIFVNVPNYARNTERRLELCVESLFSLLAEIASEKSI